jgi:uncharacterized protein YhaN
VKILELQMTAFGPFAGQTLDLSSGNPGLHVVFGPNEAGKSSALRALHALLYGIPDRTTDAFLHPYNALRIGGRLRHSGGTEISFVRRKGNKNTLLAPDGTRLDDHALDRFLGGESAEKFHAFWGIDHARLVEGGREILEGRGNMGESIFAAGSGVSNLRKLRFELEDEAAALYTPRGHQRAVNQAIDNLKSLRAAQRDTTISAEDWGRRQQILCDATETVEKLTAQERDLARERSRIERVKRVLPLLAERKVLRERFNLVADAKPLSEDFPHRRQQAETALRTATQILERAEQELRDQKALVEQLGAPSPLVAESDVVNKLHVDLGQHRAARGDRPRLVAQLEEQAALAKRHLAEVRPDIDVDGAAALRVFVGRRDRIQKLATERGRLDERLASARRDGEKASGQKKLLEHSAAELPLERDPEPLANAITETRRGGNAEDGREQAEQVVKRLSAQRNAGIEKLGLSARVADRLDELRVPSAAAIARFEARRKTLEDGARTTNAERQRLDKELQELNVKIETLHTKKSVPTEDDLVAARTRRDDAFNLLREQWEKGRDVMEKARKLLGKGNLIELYPHAVTEADEVSDRLRADAEHVAKLAQYVEDHARLGTGVETAEASARREKELAAEMETEWQTLWKPVISPPPSVDEAQAWRTDFDRLIERSNDLAEAHEKLQKLDRWIEKQGKSLRSVITELESDTRLPAGLEAILLVGEKLHKRIEAEQRTRSDHGERTRNVSQDLLDAEKASRDAKAEIADWERRWAEATVGLLPGDAAPPDDVLLSIDTIEKVLQALDHAAGFSARIAGIDRDIKKFQNDARTLAQRLGVTIEDGAEDQWVEDMHRQLANSLKEEERRKNASDQFNRLHPQVERDRKSARKAEDALSTLRVEAGCAAEDDLMGIEQRSIERRHCKTEIERIEHDLVQSGDGTSIAELEVEAGNTDRDTMDVRLGEIGRLLAEIETQLTAAHDARAAAQAQVGLLSGPSLASEKAEEIQGTLAKLRDDVVRYARLRVASTLLARRIDDYRRRNQAPLLLRAGAHFRTMTLGTFERLDADMDDDRPILAGIRSDGSRVPANGMSEGTRDQLFLALRLAAVEASCATGEPLPFIVDDVLVQFDDVRSAAGLQVLANVGEITQIVLFTHHRHVREAAEAISGQVIVHILA